ncbi:hypothetical protein LUZ60_005705 [Juncus effusus]|nr:hypothetical protein LUZ60_005705 [Juncus effusus]
MERDLNPNPNPNPWYNNTPNSHSQWEYTTTTTNNLIPIPPLIPPPLIPHQNNNSNSALFPTYNNPYGYGFSPFQLYPNPVQFPYNLPPPNPYNFPTIIPNPPLLINPTINGTIDGTIDDGTESEMQEDSEEIDALLYSDSDDYYNNNDDYIDDEFELDSPVIITGEEVASTSVHPKKRRLGTDLNASVMDTASSANFRKNNTNNNDGDLEFSDAESSCVGEEREEGMSERTDCMDLKLKRKRIQETVGLLRRIIPGGKGKDAATILDEAICYLKSLKLKARALGTR